MAGPDKNAYLRYKTFEPEEIIIHQGDIENTVFRLLKGEARIHFGDKVLSYIKPITCFGEQTVVDSQDRTATVEVPEDKEAEVVEIDWGITEQDHELLGRLLGLGQNSGKEPVNFIPPAKKELGNSKLKIKS